MNVIFDIVRDENASLVIEGNNVKIIKDGNVLVKCKQRGGKLYGLLQIFERGVVVGQFSFMNDKPFGTSCTYYSNGEREYEIDHEEGICTFYDNSKIISRVKSL